MNKKAKTIVIIIITLIIVSIGALKLMEKDFNNSDLDTHKELKVTFQYNQKLENEYKMNINGEQRIIQVSDIEPTIDTSVIGKTKHTIKIDKKDITLNVVIDDLRRIKLVSESTIEVSQGISKEDLESILLKDLVLEGVSDKNEISLGFNYPQNFDLNKKGTVGQVIILAKYKDNETNRNDIRITVTIPNNKSDLSQDVDKKKPESVKPEPGETEPTLEPVKPKPIKPEPVRPVRPEPVRPVRPEPVKPQPVIPSGPRFPLLYPKLLPIGSQLVFSNVKPWIEEYHNYDYSDELPSGGLISEMSINFNENTPYNVTLYGQDKNGEVISFCYEFINGSYKWDWQKPDVTDEDIILLYKIAKQLASAYDF